MGPRSHGVRPHWAEQSSRFGQLGQRHTHRTIPLPTSQAPPKCGTRPPACPPASRPRTCRRSPGVDSSVLTSVVLPSPLSPTIRTLMNLPRGERGRSGGGVGGARAARLTQAKASPRQQACARLAAGGCCCVACRPLVLHQMRPCATAAAAPLMCSPLLPGLPPFAWRGRMQGRQAKKDQRVCAQWQRRPGRSANAPDQAGQPDKRAAPCRRRALAGVFLDLSGPTLWGRGRLGPSSAAWLARAAASKPRPDTLPAAAWSVGGRERLSAREQSAVCGAAALVASRTACPHAKPVRRAARPALHPTGTHPCGAARSWRGKGLGCSGGCLRATRMRPAGEG